MRITGLETLCLSRIHEPEHQWITSRYRTIKADCAIIIVHTDGGIEGIGEASAYGWPLMIRDWVNWFAPALIGRDPEDPAIAPHPTGEARAHDAAAAGIDCALWDLRGKITGKRVSQLLSDTAADKVRLYASGGCGYDWRVRPEQLIDEALGYVAEGYTAMKFRIGTEWEWDGVTVDRFLGLVRELNQEIHGRMDLMLDGNCRLSEEQALAIATELDRLGFVWFEEPMPRDQIAAHTRLAAAVEMPISGGEVFTTSAQFRPYLDGHAYDIVQPDAALCGISEAHHIAGIAHRYGVPTTPHSWHNGLMAMEHAHLVAALAIPMPLELCQIQGPLQWAVLAEKPAIEDGYLILPDRPGLGVTLASNLEQTFPYIEGHYAVQVQR
jgi:L-alanine-DL-glutamate epimerase-like enolase superfamily enzyme